MAAFSEAFQMVSADADRATEALWQEALSPGRLMATKNEVMLPYNVTRMIGPENVQKLKDRLSIVLSEPVHAVLDDGIKSVRLIPESAANADSLAVDLADYMELSKEVREAVETGQVQFPITRRQKIPRPPNSFILYRQHHHAEVTAEHPGLPNTEISKMIGRKWRNETPATRLHWQNLAEKAKADHAQRHPNYQYSPRRPGEKPTRRRRIRSEVVRFIEDSPRGDQRLMDSVYGDGTNPFDCDGFIDIDDELMIMLDKHDIIYGANGILSEVSRPSPNPFQLDFTDMVTAQAMGRSVETIRCPPLQGDEFMGFTDAEMRSLEEADQQPQLICE